MVRSWWRIWNTGRDTHEGEETTVVSFLPETIRPQTGEAGIRTVDLSWVGSRHVDDMWVRRGR